MRRILSFYANNSSKVEVYKGGSLKYKYFPILPFCKFQSEYTKEKFKEDVDRSNAKSKCDDLIDQSDFIIIELKQNYWLKTGLTKLVGIFMIYLDILKMMLAYIIFIINVIILFSFDNRGSSRTEIRHGGSLAAIIILGLIGLFMAIMIYINALVVQTPIIIKKYNIVLEDEEKHQREQGIIEYDEDSLVDKAKKHTNYSIGLSIRIATDWTLLYLLSICISILLGIVAHPFWFTYTLSYIVYRSVTLLSVLKAIWNPRYTIGISILMMLMAMYTFTVYAYTFYDTDYGDNT